MGIHKTLMSASKKILRFLGPKLQKILWICPRSFANPHPVVLSLKLQNTDNQITYLFFMGIENDHTKKKPQNHMIKWQKMAAH